MHICTHKFFILHYTHHRLRAHRSARVFASQNSSVSASSPLRKVYMIPRGLSKTDRGLSWEITGLMVQRGEDDLIEMVLSRSTWGIWEIPAVEAINQATAYHATGRCSNDSSMLGIGWGTWTYRPSILKDQEPRGNPHSHVFPRSCSCWFLELTLVLPSASLALLDFSTVWRGKNSWNHVKPRCSALNLTFPHPANSQAEISPQFVD